MTVKTIGRGFASVAQLALVAIIGLGLFAATQFNSKTTSPSLKTKTFVAAPSKEDLATAAEALRLDLSLAALTPQDAALYRTIFAAQKDGDIEKADRLLAKVSDKRLAGSVMADRFERHGATAEELAEWLKTFSAQPEAVALYDKALKLGAKNLSKPRTATRWGTGNEMDSAANFSPEMMVQSTAPNSTTQKWARQIQLALRKGDAVKARDLFLEAQKQAQLAGTFAADAEAVIAEAFFRAGERQQATALATAAAGANQPLGLWIRGLIAWEAGDYETSHKSFEKLAGHPALTANNKSAAHFWAYRAESRRGNRSAARDHLREAAAAPRSFYGLLASQLLGRPSSRIMGEETGTSWSQKNRDLLLATKGGWRALALLQVGQTARAEAELQRLNPVGKSRRREAMLALAHHVPMPSLALRLASLSGTQDFDPAAYPLLPWQPAGGYQVDRALLFALARQESLLNPKAVSARGARGLLQIMPATADHIMAGDKRLRAMAEERKLIDPAFNIALGQKYVQELATHPTIGDNLMLLLAAYNGGPTKMAALARNKGESDPLFFLESMPVRETRNYIARVLPHYWAYSTRLGKPTTALLDLAEGKWPKAQILETGPVRMASAAE